MRGLAVAAALAASLFVAHQAIGADRKPVFIDGVAVTTETIASGFTAPVFLVSPPGDRRLFVVEQGGLIKIIEDGATLPQPFLDLSAIVATNHEERGLLGLAFDPDFARNGKFYVDYTPDGAVVVAAGHAAPGSAVADAAPLTPLLTIPHPQGNHNGGWLAFGPDNYLYIGVGDGGGAGDISNHAQTPGDLLGKILRLDVGHGAPYAIPAGNPFARGGGAPEVFALGLRNPWRDSFDGTSLYIGDVGQDEFEEVDVVSINDKAPNLGWHRVEGTHCYTPRQCDTSGTLLPIYTYDHQMACSITGGYVYRGKAIPALAGRYFFGDYCTGMTSTFRYANGAVLDVQPLGLGFGELGQLTSFGVDAEGELYLLTANGVIDKVVPAD